MFKIITLKITNNLPAGMRAGLLPYLFGQLVSLALLAFSAVVSYSAYLSLAGLSPFRTFAAALATVTVAGFALVLVNFIARIFLMLARGYKLSPQEKVTFFVSLVLTLGVCAWDISVNYKGTNELAETVTEKVDSFGVDLRSEFEEKRKEVSGKFASARSTVEGMIKKIDSNTGIQHNCREKGCGGSFHWRGYLTKPGERELSRLKQELSRIYVREETELSRLADQERAFLAARSEKAGKAQSKLEFRAGTFRGLVWAMYLLVFFIALWSADYTSPLWEESRAAASSPVGFQPGRVDPVTAESKTRAEFLKKYANVLPDLLGGEKTFDEIAKTHNISRSTVKNISRTLKNQL